MKIWIVSYKIFNYYSGCYTKTSKKVFTYELMDSYRKSNSFTDLVIMECEGNTQNLIYDCNEYWY